MTQVIINQTVVEARIIADDVLDVIVSAPGAGVSDHGDLTGLADDDHPHYHNDARGDDRYSQLGHGHAIVDVTGLQASLDGSQPDIQFKDDGADVGTAGGISVVNFAGAGVSATEAGGALTVTVPGTAAAGSSGELQYNAAGTTAGTSGMTYTPTNRVTAVTPPTDTDPDGPVWYEGFQYTGWTNGPVGETNYRNPVWHAGWNWRGGLRVDTDLPAAGLSFESKFYQSGTFASEFHLQGIDTSGGSHRWLTFFLPHGTDQSASGGEMTLKYFGFSDHTGVQRVLFDLGAATPVIGLTGIQFRHVTNNIPFAQQLNAAGDAYVTILKLDNYDRVAYGAPVYVNASPESQFNSILPINATGLTDGDSIIYAQGSNAPTGTLYAIDMFNLSATDAVVARWRNTDADGHTIIELSNAPGTGDVLVSFHPAYGGSESYSVGVDLSRAKFVIANRHQSFDSTDGTDRLVIDDNVIEAMKPVKLPSFTVSTVPSASTVGAGSMAFVSNEAGGAVVAFSDGTDWRRVTDRAVVS